jgi:RNA polymerase sigma factor (sigma-70 family)
VETARETKGLTTEMTTPSEQHNRERFFSSASQQLDRLYEFVRHQLAYFESVGDLMPGELTAEDIVDAAVLRAYHEFVKEPAGREIEGWLIDLAKEQLRRDVKRIRSERNRTVHIEEDIPETPPQEEVTTLGEEILEFYQPDEDLKLEDIFPDVDISTPEQMAAAKEELLRCVNAALARMPREWRRALRLRHGEGLTDEELAEALDKAEPEIERILDYARQHLRQSLLEAGCTFIVKGSENRSRAKTEAKSR